MIAVHSANTTVGARLHHLPSKFPFACALLATLAILLIRSWRDVFWPALLFEDRTYQLSVHFSNHALSEVTYVYNGYASIFPHFLAWLLTSLPANWIPYGFSLTSILVCAVTMSTFASRDYRWLLADDKVRIAACLLMAALPLGRNTLVSGLTNTQSQFLFLSFLLSLQNPQQSRSKNLVYMPIIAACIASHPVSILCLLPCTLMIMIAPMQRKFFAALQISAAIAYNYFYVDKHSLDVLTPAYILFKFFIAAAAFIGRGILEPWIGPYAATGLLKQENGLLLTGIIGMLLLAASLAYCFLDLFKSRQARLGALCIFVLGFLQIFVSVLMRNTGWGWQQHIHDINVQRYIYATRLCLVPAIFCLLFPMIRRQFFFRHSNKALFALLLILTIYPNKQAAMLYQADISSSQILLPFMREIRQEIASGNVACLQHNDCIRILNDPDPRWPITMDLRNH